VLDDVERRRFLVKPTGKDPAPALVRLLDVDLDEGAGQLFLFPRRGCLAGAQAHDHVLPPRRLPRMKRDVLDDSITFVEDAENRDALRHRRHPTLPVRSRCGLPRGRQRILLLGALAARNERDCSKQGCRGDSHAYSGIQGS
jgi:hypothetical protein